jgi:hypothetical protein
MFFLQRAVESFKGTYADTESKIIRTSGGWTWRRWTELSTFHGTEPRTRRNTSRISIINVFTCCSGFCVRVGMVPGIPRKHAHSVPATPLSRVRHRNFCLAKDQASSSLDGLLRKTRHPAPMIYFGKVNKVTLWYTYNQAASIDRNIDVYG